MGFLPEIDSNGFMIEKKHNPFKKRRIRDYLKPKRKKKKRRQSNLFVVSYQDYIRSKKWLRRRIDFYNKFGKKCSICKTTKNLHVHHIVYGQFGLEKDSHLAVVCKEHHNEFHEKYGSKQNMTEDWLMYIEECKQ